MYDKKNIAEIAMFLEEAKSLVTSGKYDFVPRRKNLQSLAKYGLTIEDAKEEILELTVGDYYKGPKLDFDRPGVLWEFKKYVGKTRFYIKNSWILALLKSHSILIKKKDTVLQRQGEM